MFYSKSDIINEICTSTIRLRLLKNSIIHYTYTVNETINIEHHSENHIALKKIATLKQHPLLIDAFDFVNFTNEARKHIRSLEPVAPILARAIVTESLANKLSINFYTTVFKPIYPLKVFANYESAVKWLLSLVK